MLCDRLNIDLEDLKINKEQPEIQHFLRKTYLDIIDKKDANIIKKKLNKSKNVVGKLVNPTTICFFDLIKLHSHLYQRNQQLALTKLNELNNKLEYMTTELKFYYFKGRGLYEYLYGSLDKSLSFYKRAKFFLERIEGEEADLYFQLSLVYSRLMDIDKAISSAQKSLDLFSRELNLQRIVDCNMLIGINYNKQGDYELAEKQFQKILPLLDAENEIRYKGKIYHNLGNVYALKREFNKSIEYLEKAIHLKRNPEERIKTSYLLAYAHKSKGNTVKALQIIKENISLALENDNHIYYCKFKIMEHLTNSDSDLHSLIQFIEKEALQGFQKYNSVLYTEALLMLAKLNKKVRHYKESAHYFEQYIERDNRQMTKELLH